MRATGSGLPVALPLAAPDKLQHPDRPGREDVFVSDSPTRRFWVPPPPAWTSLADASPPRSRPAVVAPFVSAVVPPPVWAPVPPPAVAVPPPPVAAVPPPPVAAVPPPPVAAVPPPPVAAVPPPPVWAPVPPPAVAVVPPPSVWAPPAAAASPLPPPMGAASPPPAGAPPAVVRSPSAWALPVESGVPLAAGVRPIIDASPSSIVTASLPPAEAPPVVAASLAPAGVPPSGGALVGAPFVVGVWAPPVAAVDTGPPRSRPVVVAPPAAAVPPPPPVWAPVPPPAVAVVSPSGGVPVGIPSVAGVSPPSLRAPSLRAPSVAAVGTSPASGPPAVDVPPSPACASSAVADARSSVGMPPVAATGSAPAVAVGPPPSVGGPPMGAALVTPDCMLDSAAAASTSFARGAGMLRALPFALAAARAGRVADGRSVGMYSSSRMGGHNGAEVYVSGAVDNRRVEWLLDTGAQCSVVSSEVISGLDVKMIPPMRQPVTVDGSALDLACVIICDVTVGDQTLRDQPLYVVRSLTPSCILGTDVLKRLGTSVSIDFSANTVSVRRCNVSEVADCVRLSKGVCIPPKHQSVVLCSVPPGVCGDVVVEPSDLSDHHAVMCARSVAQVSPDHLIPVRLLNPTSREVTLPSHAVVARLVLDSCLVDPGVGVGNASSRDWIESLVRDSDLSDDDQQNALRDLLIRHEQAFSLNGELGQCGIVKHAIPLVKGAQPVAQPPRRVNVNDRREVEDAVQKMQRDGVIRSSCSPWSSPIVPVRKKDGTLRLCVDYRRLNDVTHGDSHPLPRVEDCLDALSGSVWFSVLDLQSGYWQQDIVEGDVEKNCFFRHTQAFGNFRGCRSV